MFQYFLQLVEKSQQTEINFLIDADIKEK